MVTPAPTDGPSTEGGFPGKLRLGVRLDSPGLVPRRGGRRPSEGNTRHQRYRTPVPTTVPSRPFTPRVVFGGREESRDGVEGSSFC